MRHKLVVVGFLILFGVLLPSRFVVVSQSSNSNKRPIIERYGKVIKQKEFGFKEARKWKQKRGEQEYIVMDWAKGDSSVDIESLELDSAEEASAALQAALNVPVAVGTPKTKLTNLGDEAYINVSPHGSAQMFIRKGSIYLRLNATSPKLAKRFARHLVDSMDSN